MSVVAVPKILREKLTDDGAEALVQLIGRVEEQAQKVVLEMAEERFEKRVTQVQSALETKIAQVESRLESKIDQVESRLETKIGQVESKLETKIGQVESKLETKIAQSETRLIRWMFAFWVGQFASIVGTLTAILFAFLKH